ncbi:hypothetical protein INR49_022453 [Caranx melampygus]|nr:hypothetical protein INR49_022453 [Caranx melampygus]
MVSAMDAQNFDDEDTENYDGVKLGSCRLTRCHPLCRFTALVKVGSRQHLVRPRLSLSSIRGKNLFLGL